MAENVGLYDRPQEAAGTALNFFLELSQQTWLRLTALSLGCFLAGLWVDWFLRRLDGSRAERRKALGAEMANLGKNIGLTKYHIDQVSPQIMSYLAAARRLGIWAPDDRIFSILTDRSMKAIKSGRSYMEPTREVFDYVTLERMIVDYLTHVGTMLRGGNFREAKQYAKKSRADFDKIA